MPPALEHKYEIGIFAVESMRPPGWLVVPVALNSGHVWGRNSWRKYPGVIDVDFLPAIPGLDRKSFMAALESVIEIMSAVLDAPYLKAHHAAEEHGMDGSQGRPDGQENVLGGRLTPSPHDPVTGFSAMAAAIPAHRIAGCISVP